MKAVFRTNVWTLEGAPTKRFSSSESPYGRGLKRTPALLQPLPRTKAISLGLRLAVVRFRTRRDIELVRHSDLIRGSLVAAKDTFQSDLVGYGFPLPDTMDVCTGDNYFRGTISAVVIGTHYKSIGTARKDG